MDLYNNSMNKKIRIVLFLLLSALAVQGQSVKSILKDGDKKYQAKEYENALKIYEEGTNVHPNNALLNFKTGLTYLSLPRKSESLRYLQKAFTIDPSVDNNIYYYLGMSYQSNRQYEKALEFFSEAKKRNKEITEQVDKKIRQSQFADSLTRIPSNVVVENIGNEINSSFHEYSPLVSADGNTIIFTSNRPDAQVAGKKIQNYEDIYISKRNGGIWSLPKKISANINIKFNDAAAFLSSDGKTLVLYYEYGGGDIYTSTLNGDEWTKPVALNANINTPLFWEASGFLTSDGKQLYFTSNKPGGMGNVDIYVSEMEQTGDWGKAENLGPVINTTGREDSPALDPDGTTLYFSSDGHPNMGGTDIFKSELKDGKWQKPVNLGYPINSVEDDSFFAIADDRKRAYFSTMREEGNAEIYTLTFVEPQLSVSDVIAPGIPADTTSIVTDKPAVVAATTPPPVSRNIARESPSETSVKVVPETKTPESNKPVTIGAKRFLYFGIGKEDLTVESTSKLAEITNQLAQDPAVKVLIEGHTDNTGSAILNMALSVKRANAVAKYLTQQGIDPKRLSLKAYGATRPLVSNDDEKEGREINRRIELSFTN
jgi:outer membrane protein OmpA-like peptidoglycan-associated protein/tetratricopeptide (TPR) repeat protein